jgi:hypothetical protein
MSDKKTLGIQEVSDISGLSKSRIRAICNTMNEADKDALGVYWNTSGWQIPPAALKDDFFKRKRRKKS